MALIPDNVATQLDRDDIKARFGIAQDGKPTQAQLEEQAIIRDAFATLAQRVNANVADSRAKSIALTHLEDALMWTGKAIFQPSGVR
jgi:hypothetical protein